MAASLMSSTVSCPPAQLRLAIVSLNAANVLYIFVSYLAGNCFDRLDGQVVRWVDLVARWEIDVVLEHLKNFTFSHAMLYKLNLYVFVGTFAAIIMATLETHRIKWLQALVLKELGAEQGRSVARSLGAFMWIERGLLCSVLFLAPFHVDMPLAHYLVAAVCFSLAFVVTVFYKVIARNVEGLAGGSAGALGAWSQRTQRWVVPVLNLQLLLFVVTGVSGVLKVAMLGDNLAALLFGVLETVVILSMQLFIGCFVVDDMARSASDAPSQCELVPQKSHARPTHRQGGS